MFDNQDEILPIVDEAGHVIGKATRGECHGGSKLLHPVVHIQVYDTQGRLYLQKRPDWKEIQPGRWDTAVGGHVDYGETINEALLREANEELGLSGISPYYLMTYVYESERERELVYVYRLTVTEEPLPTSELAGGRFWSLCEIHENLGKGCFTPNFEEEYSRLSRI